MLGRIPLFCPRQRCREGLSSRPLLELPVDSNHVILACPFCTAALIRCENCSSLLEDVSISMGGLHREHDDETRVCRKCGFINVVDDRLRKTLNLSSIRPVSIDTARVLNRSISEQSYLEYKQAELEALQHKLDGTGNGDILTPECLRQKIRVAKRRRDGDTQDSPAKRTKMADEIMLPYSEWKKYLSSSDEAAATAKMLDVVKSQVNSLRDPAMRTADIQAASRLLNRGPINSPSLVVSASAIARIGSFSHTNLHVLRALYQVDEQDESSHSSAISILAQVESWMREECFDLESAKQRLDVASRMAEYPLPQSTHNVPISTGSPKINTIGLVTGVLKFRRDQMRNRFSRRADKYLDVLEQINGELQRLYTQLKKREQSLATIPNESEMPYLEALLCDSSEMDVSPAPAKPEYQALLDSIERTKSKVALWRSLYQSLSSCVT